MRYLAATLAAIIGFILLPPFGALVGLGIWYLVQKVNHLEKTAK